MSAKYQVISRLINEEPLAEIASVLDLPYSTVVRYNKEYKDAVAAGTLATIVDMDSIMMESLAAQTVANVDADAVDAVVESLQSVVNTKTKLDALSEDFQSSAWVLSSRIKALGLAADNAVELSVLAESLCTLQNAFFNANSVAVNVQNNYGTPYGDYLSDDPAPPVN